MHESLILVPRNNSQIFTESIVQLFVYTLTVLIGPPILYIEKVEMISIWQGSGNMHMLPGHTWSCNPLRVGELKFPILGRKQPYMTMQPLIVPIAAVDKAGPMIGGLL